MKTMGLPAAGLLALGAGQATAQEAPPGKRAGDFVLGLGAIGVLPTNRGRAGLIGGTP